MINVTKTYLPDKEKYKKYIDEIYENCWVTNNGTLVQKLEKRLAEYLGVKNIHLGPTLPGFLSANVAKVLIENFGIAGIGTVEDDVAMFMA